ncbi:MAG TPA: RtcB family protein [Myxococcota bacterium]|nr:RtcB family protein [Myxococcota bacterium]HQK51295.1 RtcB family protein [Myxococcota bacterium]
MSKKGSRSARGPKGQALGPVEAERIDEVRLRIPRRGPMRTDGIVYADADLARGALDPEPLRQVAAVACLPGIVGSSLAMPDIHWGYGFPIGGVAAFDLEDGVVSPGGVGYDIHCGVRLIRSDLERGEVVPRLEALVRALFDEVPTGVGAHQKEMRLSARDLREVCRRGAAWAIEQGFGESADLAVAEDEGTVPQADPGEVSDRAFERGSRQLGTLGSGNHFLEIGVVEEVFDRGVAEVFGLREGGITVLIHTGSRGLGHQVCTDFLERMDAAVRREGLDLPDRQLACAPIRSPEGRSYLAAMNAAANVALANRQMITAEVRRAFETVFGGRWQDLGLRVVQDVAHNIARIEEHEVAGRRRRLCVHRKGATRALPPGHPLCPGPYRSVGQPVLVPGDMGRESFVLVGTEGAVRESFASACHGAGRLLSRSSAIRQVGRRDLAAELRGRGIVARAASRETLAEEAPEAYKDVAAVVRVVHRAGLARPVARIRPLGVAKG